VVDDFDLLGASISAKSNFDLFTVLFDCLSFDIGEPIFAFAHKYTVV
jgi:hypothetical protein